MAFVIYVALVRIAIYAIAAPNYGYFRDELYYLACGEHPAWGYVDQPPLIAWIAWLLEHTIGTSLYALRLLPMMGDVGGIFVAGLLARDLGGKRWAMVLAAMAVLVMPIFLGLSHLFTMNAFDPMLWALLAWLMVKLVQSGDEKLWLWIGALVGVTLLNKYGVTFFMFGLLVGVLITSLRRSFARPWFWLGVVIAMVIALPNFLWQRHWNYPFAQLIVNVRQRPRDVMVSPLPYLWQQTGSERNHGRRNQASHGEHDRCVYWPHPSPSRALRQVLKCHAPHHRVDGRHVIELALQHNHQAEHTQKAEAQYHVAPSCA